MCVALVAGCTLFTDLGDLSGTDGGPSDVGLDASAADVAVDVSPPIDAGMDSFVDASSRFCPQDGAILCSDFDDEDAASALPGPWDQINTSPQATVKLDAANFRSAPRSVEMGTTNTTGAGHTAVLIKGLSGAKGVTVSFDLYIDTRGSNLTVASFDVGSSLFLGIEPQDDTTTSLTEAYALSDGGVTYGATTGPPIAAAVWTHVDFDLDLSSRKGTLMVGGVSTIQRALVAQWSTVNWLSVELGTLDSLSTMHFDNVTIRTR